MPITGRPVGPQPSVSLLVAMRNEETSIDACLRSILDQTYPAELIEVLVFDGASTDRSAEIAAATLADRPNARIVPNPKRTQAAAWNAGIELATGDVIGIVSGHAALSPDYVSAAIETLVRTGAAMVGGPVQALAEGALGEAIAVAMSVPFGVGGARFRYLTSEERVDTVFMGLASRDVYDQFRFDEEMVRNQDDELSYRMLDAGAVIVCNPAIRSSYRTRSTLRSLFRQYFAYGYWKVRVIQKHPRQVRPRHLVPLGLVTALTAASVAAILWRPLRLAPVAIVLTYVAADVAASMAASNGRAPRTKVVLPAVFPVLHLAYGFGMAWGIVVHRRWNATTLRAIVGSFPAPRARASERVVTAPAGRDPSAW